MSGFFSNIVYNFMIAFGVMAGASVFAGIGAIITNHPPFKTMMDIAGSIKLWAVAIALGGTFTSFEVIEKGLLRGEVKSIVKQALYILMSVLGANAGNHFIHLLKRCGETWLK